jgi:uncharacterized protein (TIGR02099 family)
MPQSPARPPLASLAVAALPRAVVRLTFRVLVVLVAFFCALLLTLRFLILPSIENYRPQISAALERQIGDPVNIGGLAGGWDGWNPRLDIDNLRVVDRRSGLPVLTLPAVHLTIAWTSLLYVELRFKEAVFDHPQLDVSRDAQGALHVAGLTFDASAGADPAPAEWLLRQRRILVHDGAVTWRDELRNAPPLELTRVEFRMENRFGRHRFGLTGVPPAAIAAPVDLRGDVTAHSLADWRTSSGRLYARLDYADVAAWQAWLQLPFVLRSGKGAVRVWLEYGHGEPLAGVADLVLVDVQATLAPDLQELALDRLDGRVGWRSDGTQREIFTEHLAFNGPGGAHFDPTDFKLVLRPSTSTHAASGEMEFSNLQLAPLMQVAATLPLPERWRHNLARYNPRGTLTEGRVQWDGEAAAPQSYVTQARFSDLGIDAQDRLPGFSGLSGRFDATDKGGSLSVQSRAVQIEMPHLFAERVPLDSLQGNLAWQREGDSVAVTLGGLAFANAQIAGTASGSYRTTSQGPGSIELNVQLPHADVRDIYRYVPVTVSATVRDWLRRGLVSGTASDARLRLSGNLADFPFADGKGGQFLVTAKAQDVTLDYAEGWPKLTALDGDVRFEGARMSIDAQKGQAFDAQLSNTKVEIANLRAPYPVLSINGEASGPTPDFLRFVSESPVSGWIEHFTDGAEASGTGKLALKIDLPLGKPEDNHVAGAYTFSSNRIKLPRAAPVLTHLNGTVEFDGRAAQPSVSAVLTADVLGGATHFNISSSEGHLHVEGQGSLDAAQMRLEFPQLPLLQRVSGTTDWQFTVVAAHEGTTWSAQSNLRGLAIDLPPPMQKPATEAVSLQIERRAGDGEHDTIVARYGRIAQLTLQRRLTGTDASVERGLLAFGGADGEPDRPGLWARGRVDALNVDGWLLVKREFESTEAGEVPALSGIDLTVHQLDVFGRRFSDLHIGATRGSDSWQIALTGHDLAGTARWQMGTPERPNGRIAAHLQRLTVPSAVADAAPSKPDEPSASNPWPEIDIVSDSFVLHDRDLGRLALLAQPLGADWQIERVDLGSDDGKLSAQGWWRAAGRVQQTTLDATLDVVNAGRYLARFGLPDAVIGAPSKLRGQVSWAGGPQAFDYPTLSGFFSIVSGKGQFTKVDPGAGKLLGVLSLQSLARRLTLDFSDLAGEGFAFDEITGEVRIQNGVMKSDNLRIVGPAAHIEISGEANLARETQQLKVRVQPTLSASVSVGAALLLLANPIVGAAVAAGSLLAQKVMRDPVEQMFALDYVVSGSWSDPHVERAGVAATSAGSAESSPR